MIITGSGAVKAINNTQFFNTKSDQFACSCCGEFKIDSEFILQLDAVRAIAGVPFKITSGYRCPEHNAAVGGVKNSPHMGGFAVDILALSSAERFKIINATLTHGLINRIGIGEDFIHLDNDPSKTPHLIWHYYRVKK